MPKALCSTHHLMTIVDGCPIGRSREQIGLNCLVLTMLMICACSVASWSQEKRKIIIDQDAAGPGGTDQQSILLLIQSPQTDVLGITVVTGDAWLHDEVAHTL